MTRSDTRDRAQFIPNVPQGWMWMADTNRLPKLVREDLSRVRLDHDVSHVHAQLDLRSHASDGAMDLVVRAKGFELVLGLSRAQVAYLSHLGMDVLVQPIIGGYLQAVIEDFDGRHEAAVLVMDRSFDRASAN